MKALLKSQKGITLVELLVVVVLIGLISLGLTTTILQTFNVSSRTSNSMVAVRQVQQAGKEVSKDVLQSQPSKTEYDTAGKFLALEWRDHQNQQHVVIYRLQDMPGSDLKILERSHSVNEGDPAVTHVARYIDPGGTTCGPGPDGRKVIFTVTATVGGGPQGATEVRTYEIDPRPDG